MPKIILSLSAALLLMPSVALAAPATQNDEGATVEREGAVTEIIFGIEDNVDGEVLSPNGTQVGGRVAEEHESMIGIRRTFSAQLILLSRDI